MPVTKLRRSERVGQPSEPTLLSPALSDAELSERLAQGDRWARAAVYRKYVQIVWGLALRLVGDRADAEEVLRKTFAEALRDAKQVRDRRMLRSWLTGLTVHHARRKLRWRRLLRSLGFDRSARTMLDEPDIDPQLRGLAELLDRLSTRRRVAWCLRYMEGCSIEEVAAFCGCSLATAKRELTAAQRVVREQLEIAEPNDG